MIDAILLALTATVAGGSATAAPPSAPPPAAAAPAPSQRYCVASEITGTRIAQRQCRTRAEWLKRGFDPLAVK